MLTPKSLLTWMIASFFKPWSSAYFAAAAPCSASEVMVRKKTPLVLPSRPSAVSVGEEEAGETCTTLAGPVTEVRIGIDTDEMMPPMIDRHLLHLNELRRRVDGDIALALRVARVGHELAAVDAARIVDVAERHLDRLGAGLAVFAGRPGQLHDQADRDVAIGGLAMPAAASSAAAAVMANETLFMISPSRPGRDAPCSSFGSLIQVSCRCRQTTPHGAAGSALEQGGRPPPGRPAVTILLLDIFQQDRIRLLPRLARMSRIAMRKSAPRLPRASWIQR